MAIYTTAHLIISSRQQPPRMRVEADGIGFMAWKDGSREVTVSGGDPDDIQAVSDAFAALATSMRRAREVAA